MGDCPQMSATAVCRVVKNCATVLCSLSREYIKFPQPADIPGLTSNFFNIAGMPGVIGWVDDTFINITSPGGNNAELYRSRKNRFAINLMGICDHNLLFTNIICSWPGRQQSV